MLVGTCHCGAVTIELPSAPEKATSCNCSICRRLGAIWAYYEFGTVRVTGHPEKTQEYIQGDRTLATIRCATCGCITHWEPLDPKPGAHHGVNLRNFDPKLLDSVHVRRFDGADTWKFLYPMEVSTARIFVTDLAEAKSFYGTALALPLKYDGESHGFCVFRAGGLDLVVETVPADAPDDDRVLVGRFTGLSFTVPDIHSTYADLLAKGVAFSGAPEEQAWGGTLATFTDPAGNGLQLVQGRGAA